MASAAEIANDMSAHAVYWQKRDRRIFQACNETARVIRMYLDEKQVDGRTFGLLHRRLLDLTLSSTTERFMAAPNFDRALQTLFALRAQVSE